MIFNNFGKIRLFFYFEIPCQTDRESSDKGDSVTYAKGCLEYHTLLQKSVT